jgi:crotonobetainyl-CoA:carnitine CoA-transferase CaiB-like acyl-CoA transferase
VTDERRAGDGRADEGLPLAGVRVVSIAVNLPGPAAVARLAALGAAVTKVEPPAGDPLRAACRPWYDALTGQARVVTLDLTTGAGRDGLTALLAPADLLVTSHRPATLARLGLSWDELHAAHPRLCQVAIVGHPGARAEQPGHDLTYQAEAGTLTPPDLPAVLVADLAGAERAAAEGMAALLHRARTGWGCRREVALADVAHDMAAALRYGLTGPGSPLGGALPGYGVYASADGYVAVAALEPRFWRGLVTALGLDGDGTGLAAVLATRPAAEWEAWAAAHDLPVVAVRTAAGSDARPAAAQPSSHRAV